MAADAGPSLAVVLFTDLVGSTAQRAALGEERADELRQTHDRLLGERIEAHAGRVVKGLGDGLMAVFASASDALTAAVEAQQAVCVHNQRPDALAALSVRMGLSVGDVSWENGECFGTPAVEAARLVAQAEGGQILCSDFVRVMARGRGGHRFAPLGALTLKGLPEPLEACEVAWEAPADQGTERLPFPRSLVVRSPMAFVGREAEVVKAERCLERSEGFALVWLVGEPGIGKTRLAAEVARRAFDRGWDVLAGRCDEDLAVPFQPFLHALRDFVAATPEAALLDRLGHQPAELARLLPGLPGVAPGTPSPAVLDPTLERFRLFEAVRSWLMAAAAARPLLIVVDDVHWADAATVQLLGYLARTADPVPLRVVATLRDTEPESPELRHLLDDPGEASTTIGLAGLPAAGVTRLVEAATGRSNTWDATGIAQRIQAETGGNPLFVVAVLGGLNADGTIDDLPSDITAAVRRRIGRLPDAARDVLRMGAVAGLEFDLRVVCRALALSTSDGLEAIEAAVRQHLAEEVGVNRYRFAHALVRSALGREIGPSRAAHYHRLVGEATETVFSDRLDEYLDELAHHFGEAVAAGGPVEPAVRYAVAAADQASGRCAVATAAEHYRQAIQLLERDGQAGTRRHCELLLQLGEAQIRFGTLEEARAGLRRASAEADATGYCDLMARAASLFERATTYLGEPGEEAVEIVGRALRRLHPGDGGLRAHLLTSLGRALGFTARGTEGVAPLQEAIAMAKRIEDDQALSMALWSLADTVMGPEHHDVRLRSALEALELASAAGDPWDLFVVIMTVFDARLEGGDIRDIKAVLRRWGEIDRAISRWSWGPFFLQAATAMLTFLEGRLAEAETMTTAARDLGRDLSGMDPDGAYSLQMFTIRREQGRLGEIAPALRTMVQLGIGTKTWRPGLAALWAELGNIREAQAELEALIPDERVLVPQDSRRAVSLSYLCDAVVFVGDRDRAAVMYDELLPYAALCITCFRIACHGHASRYLGMLATTLGRFDDAQAHFEDALLRCDRLASPVWTAHTQYQLARMLLLRRRPSDARQAEALARAAQEAAATFGMRSLEERAGRLLESGLGVVRHDD